MTDVIIVMLCALFGGLAFFAFVPWCFRLLSLYGLHALRDRVFSVWLEHPEIRDTRAFRDADHVLALILRAVRRGSDSHVIGLYKGMYSSSLGESSSGYDLSEEQRDMLYPVFSAIPEAQYWLALRVVSLRTAWPMLAVELAFRLPVRLLRRAGRARPTPEKIVADRAERAPALLRDHPAAA